MKVAPFPPWQPLHDLQSIRVHKWHRPPFRRCFSVTLLAISFYFVVSANVGCGYWVTNVGCGSSTLAFKGGRHDRQTLHTSSESFPAGNRATSSPPSPTTSDTTEISSPTPPLLL